MRALLNILRQIHVRRDCPSIAGIVADSLITGVRLGLASAVIVGILGAFIGGWLFGLLGVSIGGGPLGAIVTAIVGAVVLLLIIRALKYR
jgi:uncharacterized membrane protein YeaQ/YmgE (transglycosylase-associated protein family)